MIGSAGKRSTGGAVRRAALLVALGLALGPGGAPAAAQSRTCPQAEPSYTGPCGPTLVLPSWGDAGGWKDPEQYETVQLADVDGDGADELLSRTPAGVAVHVFDKGFGQWRPQVTPVTVAGGVRQVPVLLTELANPPPLSTASPNPPKTDWTLPQYYDTIQAADIDGQKGAEIVARRADGAIVFKFTPGGAPGQGTWRQLTTSGPFTDADGWGSAPYRYATIHTGDVDGDGDHELFGLLGGGDGVQVFDWKGSSWTALPTAALLQYATDPAYYTSLGAANLTGDRPLLVGREDDGMHAYRLGRAGWVDSSIESPFSDDQGLPDCPFVSSGSTCFGSSLTYFGTIQFGDIDGNGRDELLGRASDGLRVRRYRGSTIDGWGSPPTLTDLSDASGYNDPKYSETIQTADINGDGRAEVLARDANGVNAWSYNPGTRSWTKLSPSTPLALADDPWGSDRAYYSTIQTGDVDGDKRADVVARGPYGIRTWFYNRRGTGGWERYLPEGYPDFPTAGQRAAFAALNSQAQGSIPGGATTVRGVWTGEGPPSLQDLIDLENLLKSIGKCTNQTQDDPVQFGSCTPPTPSTGFTGADWTAVLNEIFAENYWAQQVWQHFYDPSTGLQQSWSLLLEDQLARLPAIADSLKLDAPAETETEYTPGELWSTAFGLLGALAATSEEAEPLVPLLWMASEVASLIPSASPQLVSPFKAAYTNLENEFADGISEAAKALSEHSELVRQDQALLTLVGQLRARGTWQNNPDAMSSGGRQGFAVWVYKTLLPTIWSRYVISNCFSPPPPPSTAGCQGPPSGPWVTGSSSSFTAIGPLPSQGYPCSTAGRGAWECDYVEPPADLANILWKQMSPTCTYDGQHASTVWTFPDPQRGGCSLGIDPRTMLADPATVSATEKWGFPVLQGNPIVRQAAAIALAGRASGIGTPTGARSAGRAGARQASAGASVRLRAKVPLPRSLRMGRGRVVIDRLLFERGGERELVRHRSGRRLPPLILRRHGRGSGVFAGRGRRAPRVRVRLRRDGRRLLELRLTASDVTLPRPPRKCSGTRPGVDRTVESFGLHTRLRIYDGRRRPLTISLEPRWRCPADRFGNVRRLVLERPTYRRSSGAPLAVAVRGPRRIAAGGQATYSIKVANRRRTVAGDVLVRALLPRALVVRRARGGRVRGRHVLWRWKALRPGRSRTVRLRVGARRGPSRRACQTIVVSAIDTRSTIRRVCSRIERG